MSSTWLVTQGRNYTAERNGGYIWAPKRAKDGSERFFWTNITKINQGDIIIHYSGGLKAVSQALSTCQETTMPQELNKQNSQDNEGWQVKCDYNDFRHVLRLTEFKEEILHLGLGDRAAFNAKGGVRQGYLFELNETLASLFIKQAIKLKPTLATVPFIEEFLNREFDTELIAEAQAKKDKPAVSETMTNQMLSNLERLMALHESTQLVKHPSKIELPKLLTRKKEHDEVSIDKETVRDIADTRLRKFLEDGAVDEDEVYDMRFRDYSEATFGIECPLLLRLKALTFDDSPKYFRNPVTIRNEKFYLCSAWTEKQRSKLESWLDKLDAKVNALPEYKDVGIRDLAKGVLRDMLMAGKADSEEVEKMLTLDYSNDTFGINYPLLVKDRNPSNVANYFKLKVPIRGETYYVCSQWFEQPKNNDRPYLEKWIKEHR